MGGKVIVRWESTREDRETIRYALRTQPRGSGLEIGAYVRWDNAKSYEASEPVALAIEKKAEAQGYEIGEDSWNDLVDYENQEEPIMETLTSPHPFERAGLGIAPFRVMGMTEKLFTTPEGSKPGGTCDYCSTGILFCFAIRSADGKEFVVGSDCVRKTTKEGKLLTDVQHLKREHDKQKRREKVRAYHERIGAQYQEIFQNAETVALLNSLPHPKIAALTLLDYVSWMRENGGDSGRERVLALVREAQQQA